MHVYTLPRAAAVQHTRGASPLGICNTRNTQSTFYTRKGAFGHFLAECTIEQERAEVLNQFFWDCDVPGRKLPEDLELPRRSPWLYRYTLELLEVDRSSNLVVCTPLYQHPVPG